MFLFELLSALSFRIHARGYSHGQHDLTLVATAADGKSVGRIDYSTWRDQVAVQMIAVDPTETRKGYGTALVRRLQAEYPDTQIDFGSLTAEGDALLQTVPFTDIPNPEYAEKSERLAHLKALDAKWTAMADAFDGSAESRAKLQPLFDKWNDLNDEVYRLERELHDMTPGKRLVK